MNTSPEQRKLVGSIIEIGRSLNIEVVAEGVETQAHATILRDLGCDILQGYAFARPMTSAALEIFLRQETWRSPGTTAGAVQSGARPAAATP